MTRLVTAVDSAADRMKAAGLGFPLIIGVLSRLYSSSLILAAATFNVRNPPLLGAQKSPFVAWDGQWYLDIAAHGYHAYAMQPGPHGGHHDFAFYPGWPSVIRAVSLTRLPPVVAAVVAANVLFLCAVVVVFLVLRGEFGGDVARRGVLLLAFSPAAYVMSMAYSEPLFLLLSGSYFLLRRSKSSPLLAAATMLTRVSGLAIGASAAVAWLRDRRDWRAFASACAVALSFAGWWVYLWWLTGKRTAWLEGSASWESSFGPGAILYAFQHLAWASIVKVTVIGTVAIAGITLLRRRLELGVYSIVALGLSLIGAPVTSMPRHATVAFPAFGAVGEKLGHRGTLILAVVFGALQVWFVWLSFAGQATAAP
ncbi:MAG TPA: mannosyltransferase family protein [Candidatus Limnocylindrales bacterium]|nr:mannosyltransferase family protein [Candidatus Limnocylindrales bacterium]